MRTPPQSGVGVGASMQRSPFVYRILLNAARSLALAVALAGAFPVSAVGSQRTQIASVSLSAQDKKDLRRIENYLNGIRTLQARFVQVTDDGRYSEGKLFFRRPDKFRFEYEPPIPILMVSNRGQLTYYDTELKQVTYVPLSATPLWFLTRKRVAFDDEVQIIGIDRAGGVLRIGIVQADDPDAGQVVLTFSTRPMELRKWSITDAQGVTVNVALFNTRRDIEIDDDLFEFTAPQDVGHSR